MYFIWQEIWYFMCAFICHVDEHTSQNLQLKIVKKRNMTSRKSLLKQASYNVKKQINGRSDFPLLQHDLWFLSDTTI